MYQPSSLFRLSYQWATEKLKADSVFILSAKYGLLPARTIIEPYELSLLDLNIGARTRWGNIITHELCLELAVGDELTFLTGDLYMRYLNLVRIKLTGVTLRFPLMNKPLGVRMSWLKEELRGI